VLIMSNCRHLVRAFLSYSKLSLTPQPCLFISHLSSRSSFSSSSHALSPVASRSISRFIFNNRKISSTIRKTHRVKPIHNIPIRSHTCDSTLFKRFGCRILLNPNQGVLIGLSPRAIRQPILRKRKKYARRDITTCEDKHVV
jgi:hypothetical protein